MDRRNPVPWMANPPVGHILVTGSPSRGDDGPCVIPAWTPESSAMDGNTPVTHIPVTGSPSRGDDSPCVIPAWTPESSAMDGNARR